MNDDLQPDPFLADAPLDALFAAARAPAPADLEAADRFLGRQAGLQAARSRRRRHQLRLWVSSALGVAAATGGLLLLRPASAELPSSAAYSVYQSALGDGW